MPELSRKYSHIFKLLPQQSVPFPQDNNIHHTLVAVPHQASNTSQIIIMNNPVDSNSNADAVSLIEQVRAATQSNPSLARELSTFLLDTAPDSQPVTKEQHPVFFDATKNPGKLFVLIPNRTWCSERSRANVKFIQHQSTTRTNHHHRRRHHHQSKL